MRCTTRNHITRLLNCRYQAEFRNVNGCVHEHIYVSYNCGGCTSRLAAKQMFCRMCSNAGHQTTAVMIKSEPLTPELEAEGSKSKNAMRH